MTEQEYQRFVRPYRRILKQELLNLEFYLEDVGNINVYSIESRIKTYRSAIQKSNKIGIPVSDLQDIAGVRIVVATQKEKEVLIQFFEKQQVVEDLEIDKIQHLNKSDGYRSTHLIANFKGHYTRSMYPACIEVQIPTIFEHAYNFISRAWVYKSKNSYSNQWKSEFASLSKTLEDIDDRISSLHSEVTSSSQNLQENEPLSPFSYQQIIKEVFDEQVTLKNASESCSYFVNIGFQTTGQMFSFFKDPEIEKYWDEVHELLENDIDQANIVLTDSKESFWSMYGVRKRFIREKIEDLKSKYM